MNELISLIVQIENWEALKTARLVTIRVPPEITIEDLLSKIAKKVTNKEIIYFSNCLF